MKEIVINVNLFYLKELVIVVKINLNSNVVRVNLVNNNVVNYWIVIIIIVNKYVIQMDVKIVNIKFKVKNDVYVKRNWFYKY